jgi:hypothetical protein
MTAAWWRGDAFVVMHSWDVVAVSFQKRRTAWHGRPAASQPAEAFPKIAKPIELGVASS